MASASWSCQGAPACRSSLSNQTFRPCSSAAGASSRRCLSLRAASVSAPAWLKNRRGVSGSSDILANRVAGSGWLGLRTRRPVTDPVLPVDLLLLSDDGLYGFHKAQIRLVLVHVAVSARAIHIEALLALRPL